MIKRPLKFIGVFFLLGYLSAFGQSGSPITLPSSAITPTGQPLAGATVTVCQGAAWNSSTNYVAGAVVTYSGNLYISLRPGNLDNVPVPSSVYWVIPQAQSTSAANCSPIVTVYSDPGLTHAITPPIITNLTGNVPGFVVSGQYVVTVIGQLSQIYSMYPISIGGSGGGGTGCTGGVNGNLLQGTGDPTACVNSGISGANVAQLSATETFTANQFFASGFPEIDVQCTNDAATDTAAIVAAIAKSRSYVVGEPVVINGTTGSGAAKNCHWDGTLPGAATAFDGVNSGSPLVILLKGAILTYNAGFRIGTNDITSKVHFIAIRGGGSKNFSVGSAEVDSGDGGNYSVLDIPGIEGDFLSDGITWTGSSTTAPVVRVHTFDKTSTSCPSPPCGSTQLTFKNGGSYNSSSGGPLSFDSNGAVSRGAWSSVTTYNYDDQVTYMGMTYISAVGSNLNHVPTGGLPNWFVLQIAGFDASLQGFTLSSGSSGTPDLNVSNFGNLHMEGPQETWLIMPGTGSPISLACFNGASCDEYNFHLIATEGISGDFITSSGPVNNVVMDNIYLSDNGGAAYIFNNTGGNAIVRFSSIPGNLVTGYIDPSSAPVIFKAGSDIDYTLLYNLTTPPTTRLPVGFYSGKLQGQQLNLIRSGAPVNVRYQNLITRYLPAAWISAGFGTGTITPGISDYLGGANAGRITVSAAPYAVNLYNDNFTPTVGDIVIAVVPIRTDAAGSGLNANISCTWQGAGITQQGFGSSLNPWPTGIPNDLGWQFQICIQKVTVTDGMVHAFNLAAQATDTSSPFIIAYPILVKIPNGTISDSEAIEYAMSLVPYPPSATQGQMWNPNVEAVGVLGFLDQTGVSTANSGSPQNILTSTPAAGKYRVSIYADESTGCTTVTSGALTVVLGWTDATHARVGATLTLTPGTADTGTGSFVTQSQDIWAAASSAITVTDTFTDCSVGGPWTYDQHATVERVE